MSSMGGSFPKKNQHGPQRGGFGGGRGGRGRGGRGRGGGRGGRGGGRGGGRRSFGDFNPDDYGSNGLRKSDNKFLNKKRFKNDEEGNSEDKGNVNKFQKKANFNRNQEKFNAENEGNERGNRSFPKKDFSNNKSFGKGKESNNKKDRFGKNKKFQKNEPVKGTSVEYDQLAPSDEDNESIPDVTDMVDNDFEIPLINNKKTINKKETKKSKTLAAKPIRKEEEDEDDDASDNEEGKDHEDQEDEPVSRGNDGEEEDEEEEEESDDETERKKFREEIANMPLGKVKEMKEKLGIKLFNKTYFGVSEEQKRKNVEKKEKQKSDEKEKMGQHRPKEISSKRPVSSFRNIYGEHEQGAKKRKWDPRFDTRAGDFKEVCFENNYQFLDEIKANEIEEVRQQYKRAKAEKDEKATERLKLALQKMETREKTRAEKRRKAETRKELHDENIDRMLKGEAPVFKTKAAVRRIDMEKKYDDLKKNNNLDKYLQRKAKKEAGKQKKARPFEGFGYE